MSDALTDGERRRSPLIVQGVLLALFVAIAVVSVFTVLIPELEDDGSDPETTQPEAAEAAAPQDE